MKHQYIKNVSTLTLHEDRCAGCGDCLQVCPHAVFEMKDGKAVIARRDSCMECGACALNCAFAALEVKKGVGCAAAVIRGLLTGTEPTCG